MERGLYSVGQKGSKMSNPVPIFLRKMSTHDDASVAAAEAICDFAENNGSALKLHTRDIAAYLQSSNLNLRAAVFKILGTINTQESLELLFSDFWQQNTATLLQETSFGYPLAYWIMDALVWQQGERSDALHRLVFNFLSKVVSDTETLPARVRVLAMQSLYYNTNSNHDDITATLKFSRDVYDSAAKLADHEDTEISSLALQLLGHISHRIESVPRVTSTKPTEQRIEFDKANLKDIIECHGPFRFADVHPEDFEKLIVYLFRDGGFEVEETSYVGDYGADLIAAKGKNRVAIQVKRYASTNPVSVGDVNQVLGAMQYYDCNRSMVITTSRFTSSAITMSKKAGIIMWDWEVLVGQIEKVYGICLR